MILPAMDGADLRETLSSESFLKGTCDYPDMTILFWERITMEASSTSFQKAESWKVKAATKASWSLTFPDTFRSKDQQNLRLHQRRKPKVK